MVEKSGSSTYKIKGQNGGKPHVVHFDRLKPCVKLIALNMENPIAPKCNGNSNPSQLPRSAATPATTNYGDDDSDLLLSDDDEEQIPDMGPIGEDGGGRHALPEQPHPAPPDIPGARHQYPTKQRRPPDHYGSYVETRKKRGSSVMN